MKILHLTTTLSFAGAEQVILDLAEGPWKVEVAALTEGDGTFINRLDQASIPWHCLNMASKFEFGVCRRLQHLMNDGQFDLMHTHLVHANTVGRLALRNDSRPVVSTMHIVETRFRPWHDWAERLTAQWADALTGVSPEVCDKLIRLRLPLEKIHLVANGINTDRFHPPAPHEKRDLDVLFVGRLDQQKGLDRIFPALAEANKQNPLRLTVIGTGPLENEWKSQASQLGLPVDWIGYVPDTAPWFRRAKICLVPSRWEGFGLTAAEALASGCELLHSGVDSLTRVAGPHGHQFPVQIDRCARLLVETLAGFTENMQRQQWVVDNWSARRMRQDYDTLYRSL